MTPTRAGAARAEAPPGNTLDAILARGALHSVFQPLVRLRDGALVGYEMLTRGPAGHRLEAPLDLIVEARRTGRLSDLDWAMVTSGLTAALALPTEAPLTFFLNVESDNLSTPVPPVVLDLLAQAQRRRTLVVEFTERCLTQDPAALLRTVVNFRRQGGGVALDDLGAEPASLALLPVLDPDVVKLDMGLVRRHQSREVAMITNAVRAHCESTGAVALAEGIESQRDVLVAQALGAEYGQGWWFGRPDPAPVVPAQVARLPLLGPRHDTDRRTPLEVVSSAKELTVADKRMVWSMTRLLEDQVFSTHDTVLLVNVGRARLIRPEAEGRYAELAAAATFAAALGVDLPAPMAPGFRSTALSADEPLAGEWDVILVGPHFAGALVARDLGDGGPDLLRRYAFAITHDRELVLQAARALLHRVAPATELDNVP
jgi:EAL domain-containing protein (putative c-di-GMP-specific phosphodiesterase class I)